MIKSLGRAFFVFVLVGGLFFVSVNSLVQAYTEVSSILSSDTTWTKEASPYSLTGNVLVDKGVTLTIEAGVTVNMNSFYIMVNGTLQAQGTETDKITFNSGEITFTYHATDWNEETGSGCIIENANFNSIYVEIGSVSVKISKSSGNVDISGSGKAIVCDNIINGKVSGKLVANNTITGEAEGITVSNNIITGKVSGQVISYNTITGQVSVSGSSTISNNNITTNISDGAGIECKGGGSAVISGNIISGCDIGIYLYPVQVFGGTSNAYPLIEKNLITNNNLGISIILGSRFEPGTLAPTIKNNTITHNSVGISVNIGNYYGTPTISYNNIHKNTDYNILLDEETENNIDAPNNWWGTTDPEAISQTIYDYYKDFNIGVLNFSPVLTEPNPKTHPVIPEFSSWILLPMFLTFALMVTIYGKKLHKHR